MRPCMVHYGKAREIRDHRQRVMEETYTRDPERFLRDMPKVAEVYPREACINKPTEPLRYTIRVDKRCRRQMPDPS